MKLIDNDGNEHEITGREQAHALIKALVPDSRFGPKPGHHVERLQSGDYRYKVVDHGKDTFGPTRATWDEAAEDYRRFAAGEPLAPVSAGQGSQAHRDRARASHKRWYEAAKAASPDGKVHVGPSTCGHCREVGHKSNHCPQKGWVRKPRAVRVGPSRPRKPRQLRQVCTFCQGEGHGANACPKRKVELMARFGRLSRWAA